LLETARRRLAADGAIAATLDEIRRDGEVSVSALYHHFPDKPALAAPVYAQVRSYVTPTGRCRQFQHPDVGIVGDVNVLAASTATLSGWLRSVDFAQETTPSTNESTNR
jgi:AcrR family transcriptional regulator